MMHQNKDAQDQRTNIVGKARSFDPPCHKLEPESKHELELTRQPGPGIRRRLIVIVIVEVHRRADDSEIARVGQVCNSVADRRSRSVIESQDAGIGKLNMVEDVERLDT
jgi:hypothetical protein